jgi:hypothetical protein
MRVDVLHIEDCPNWVATGGLIVEVLHDLRVIGVAPRFTVIRTAVDAARVPFAGSPTVLIDGVDIIAGATPTTDLACRVYRDGERPAGIPARDTVRTAILSRLRDGESNPAP